MKKLLALVLALVMTLGLATVGTSAAFSDADSIKYEEAVDVMSAIGVLAGMDDGSFNPTGTLTREQGAKIITYMLLGKTAADALTTSNAPFADVAADRWSAGSIAYAVSQGIIAGVGNNKFDPTGSLTGYAFSKMLLTALGYDAAVEGLTGSDWSLNTAKLVRSIELDDGVDAFTGTNPLTREEAAQLGLNTLKATMVEYTGGTSVTTGDGTNVVVNSTKNNKGNTTSSDGNIDTKAGDKLMQFAEYYFKDLKYAENQTDDFGRPADKWTLKNDDIVVYADKPVATFNAGTSASSIASALKNYYIYLDTAGTDGWVKADDDNRVYTGDVLKAGATTNLLTKVTDTSAAKQSPGAFPTVDASGNAKSVANWLASNLAKDLEGKVVEVYANSDDHITRIVTITYKVGEVTSMSTNSAGDVSYTIDGHSVKDYADPDKDDTVEVNGTIAKNDYVTYIRVGDVMHVYPTTTVTGKQTAVNGTTLTINGTTYKVARGVAGVATTSGSWPNTTKDHTYYLDQFGFVVASEEIEGELDYAIVDAIAAELATGVDSGVTVTAKLIFPDGSKKTVTVDEINGIDTTEGSTTATANVKVSGTTTADTGVIDSATLVTISVNTSGNNKLTGVIVAYDVNSDGNYELKYGETIASNGTSVTDYAATGTGTSKVKTGYQGGANDNITTKGSAAVALTDDGNQSASSDTVYVVKSNNGSDTVVNVYTGFKNVPSLKNGAGKTTVSYVKDDGKVKLVYVNVSATGSVTGSDDIIFYATTNDEVLNGSGSDRTYSVAGIKDGVVETAVSTSSKIGDKYSAVDAATGTELNGVRRNGTFYVLTVDGEGKVTNATELAKNGRRYTSNTVGGDPVFDAAGIATDAEVQTVKNESFKGWTWDSSTKVIVLDNGKLVDGDTIETLSQGDAYYIIAKGDSGADRTTIKTIYIEKDKAELVTVTNPSVTALQEAMADGDVVVVEKAMTVSADLTIPAGKTVYFNGGLTVNSGYSFTVGEDGDKNSAVVYVAGDLVNNAGASDYITIEENGSLYTTGAITKTGGSTAGKIVNDGYLATDDLTSFASTAIDNDGKVTINAAFSGAATHHATIVGGTWEFTAGFDTNSVAITVADDTRMIVSGGTLEVDDNDLLPANQATQNIYLTVKEGVTTKITDASNTDFNSKITLTGTLTADVALKNTANAATWTNA